LPIFGSAFTLASGRWDFASALPMPRGAEVE
jgi:hypothetical protein